MRAPITGQAGFIGSHADLDGARYAARRAGALDEGSGQATVFNGEFGRGQGDTAAARSWCEEALRRNPLNAGLRRGLTEVFAERGQSDRQREVAEPAENLTTDVGVRT